MWQATMPWKQFKAFVEDFNRLGGHDMAEVLFGPKKEGSPKRYAIELRPKEGHENDLDGLISSKKRGDDPRYSCFYKLLTGIPSKDE
jgi:hypothetical protein